MRKVFPLKPSENCEYEIVEQQDKEATKLDQPAKAGIRKTETSAAKSMMAKGTSEVLDCNNSGASGDENLPESCNDVHEVSVTKPSTAGQKTHRASAYPVFTAGSSARSRGSSMRHSDKQRLTAVGSTHQSSNAQAEKHAPKETVIAENCDVRPHSSTRNPAQPKGSFRSSSLRIGSQQTGRALFPFGYGDETSCNQASDLTMFPRSRSLSRTTSERSYSETSSDCGSCFTKTTDSSSSGKSESIDRSIQCTGTGNTTFNLSARTVAEKLVKVLGKERLHWQASRRWRTAVESPDDVRYQGTTRSEIGPPSTTSLGGLDTIGNVNGNSMPMPSTPDAKDRSFNSFTNDDFQDSMKIGQGKGLFDKIENDIPNIKDLEARAAAKDAELAALLEQERRVTYTDSSMESRSSAMEHQMLHAVVGNLEKETSRLRKEKRDLTIEVAREIRARINEKKAALQASRDMETEMERKISAVEREKASTQETLERELEKRSEEWSSKLAKIKNDERKMMERLTKMAEEKTELQKEIADYKVKESSWRDDIRECQDSVSALKQRLQASEADMESQMEAASEMENRLKASMYELETVVQKNRALELENSEMQKELTRLRRICNDQEMTIEGLWRQFDEAVNDSFECRSEQTVVLQRELLRLARVEQSMRNELNAVHAELSVLKQQRGELAVLRDQDNNASELDQDLQNKVHKLETKLASLQEENRQLSFDLRTALREKGDFERRIRQRSDQEMNQDEESRNSEETFEVDPQHQLRDVDFLDSKLKSREAEIEQLYEEVAQLVSSRDALQNEVDNLHEKLSVANHRILELERKIDGREEMIETLQTDTAKRGKELNDLQGELFQVRKQRDEMRKEAECMSEEALRLTLELAKLRKMADKLEEEVMLKEGQITILRTGSVECV